MPSRQAAPEPVDAGFVPEPPEAPDAAVSAAADAAGPAHPHRRKLVVVHPAAQQAASGVQSGAEGGAAATADRGATSDGEPATSRRTADSAANGAAAPLPQQEVLPLLPVERLPLRTHWVASAHRVFGMHLAVRMGRTVHKDGVAANLMLSWGPAGSRDQDVAAAALLGCRAVPAAGSWKRHQRARLLRGAAGESTTVLNM